MWSVVSSPTPLGFDAADLIAILAVMVTMLVALCSAIGVLILRTLTKMDERIAEVKDEATEAVKDLRRDLSSDLRLLWSAIRSPNNTLVTQAGPPEQTMNGGMQDAGRG